MVKVDFVDAFTAKLYEGQQEPIVITIDPTSSEKIIDRLFAEDGSDASEGKKRKASESFFRVRQRDGSFLLAQEEFSLQLSRLPSMKKMVWFTLHPHLWSIPSIFDSRWYRSSTSFASISKKMIPCACTVMLQPTM